jgi:hypothetical protein
MHPSISKESGYQSRSLASLCRLAGWAGTWTVATALMKFGPAHLWTQAMVTMLAAGLDVAVGIGLILAHKRWLADQDELQRKIYLDALGVTLGVTVIAGVVYEFLDKQGVMAFHFSNLLILTSLTLVGSVLFGTWRYR